MLCPEVWDFKAPESTFLTRTTDVSEQEFVKTIQNFTYNHLVSVVLPDTFKVPPTLAEALTSDCDYYKVNKLRVSDLITEQFIDSFVKIGNLYVLSIDTRLDCDNCIALTPKGQLILSLNRTTYQSLGLEGRVSHFHNKTKAKFGKLSLLLTMPKHRLVPTLQSLSLKGVGTLVASLAPPIITRLQYYHDPQKIVTGLYRCLDRLNDILITHVPRYLYNTMAMEVLGAVKALIEKTKKNYYPNTNMSAFLTEMNVVVSLTEVVLNPNLKQIDFTEWPKMMRYVLYKNLARMTGMEVLNLGSCTGGWRTGDNDKYILEGVAAMKSLRSLCICFDCTDLVVQVIGDNCPSIQCLDVTSSRSVTDRSVAYLLKCTHLRELQLHRTSVTVEGLAHLIRGLPKLQDIGRCDDFGSVVKAVHQGPGGRLAPLKKVQTRGLSSEHLRLLVDMFPNIEFLNLFNDDELTDLTLLTSLDHLKDLKLLSCAFYGDYVNQLLEVRGHNITSLHLEHAEEIDLSVLIDISQHCPNLKNLVMYNCDCRASEITLTADALASRCKNPPFLSLERLFWVVDGARLHLEFILRHAINIENIYLGSSTGLTHSSIVDVLTVNPMKRLREMRILYGSDMSMRTVELLLASCGELRVLSELEGWQGISFEELKIFKQHIYKNNFDLDIRPTLSYY